MFTWGPAWGLAACIVLTLAGAVWWSDYERQRSPWEFEGVALRAHEELSRHPERLDLHTSSAREVRDWVASERGLAAPVPLKRPEPDPDALELLGARWIAFRGSRIAAIAYRVGLYPATLLIARAGGSAEAFKRIAAEDRGGFRLYTWRSGGQIYTLVSSAPDPSQRACALCHAEPQQRQMLLRRRVTG
jgi:hypothetical protein